MRKCKKKKAQMNAMGVVLVAFIGVIVALALYTSVGAYVGQVTTQQSISQGQYTLPANGACKDLVGQDLLSTVTITNKSSGTAIDANYTVSERVSSVDGYKRVAVCTTGTHYGADPLNALAVNVSYTYGPEGYIDNAGGRSMALLIPIFAALAIAVVALVPALRNGVMDMIKG